MSDFTPQQCEAISGRGNVLVVAGAGTGKTRTLVARCLRIVAEDRASLENILMVTFTEAAAAEMRARLREELRRLQAARADDEHLAEHLARQLALLDTARVGTLHSFCLQLARECFHQLGLDPQFSVLDEPQTRPLMRQALDELLERHYAGEDDNARAVQALVRAVGRGSDSRIRQLVVKLHRYSQSLPDSARWLDGQQARFERAEPGDWRQWFLEGVTEWRQEFLDLVTEWAGEAPAVNLCQQALRALPPQPDAAHAIRLLRAIQEADDDKHWPFGTKTSVRKALKDFFGGAEFFGSLLPASLSEEAVESGPNPPGVPPPGGAGDGPPSGGEDGTANPHTQENRDEPCDDPLAEDWQWVRRHMTALVSLTREFTARFTEAKRELAGVDFADLEQCALRLLRDPAIAGEWRARLDQVFVDEYQDINAAQDAILTALSRKGEAANRFLVGDVKQSIYRFRLGNPKIFQGYQKAWAGPAAAAPGGEQSPQPSAVHTLQSVSEPGRVISLTGNFRSREALLRFVNPLFAALMREDIGGVTYEALQFGAPGERGALAVKPDDAPRVELGVIARSDDENGAEETEAQTNGTRGNPDLRAVEREARLVARRLRELKESRQQIWDADNKVIREVRWSDMAVLLRSPSGRTEAFAMEFSKAGVPLIAARDGFFNSLEVSDLLHLLRLLDNPLQDVPVGAVLRSPLVGLSLDELARIRAHNSARPFWTALARFHEVRQLESKVQSLKPNVQSPQSTVRSPESRVHSPESGVWNPESDDAALRAKVGQFFDQFRRWRELVRQTSLSQCLETALVETHYQALLLAGARGDERAANVVRLLDLARQFDPYRRQGLYRFLRFVEAQEEEELDLQPAPPSAEEAVRLLSIHKSKGLEFPVVALACLGTRFNERDLNEPVLLSESYGLCPKITPPDRVQSYPSLPYWLGRRRERRELRGEELRLLYVALTRARDTLLLTGSVNRKAGDVKWMPASDDQPTTLQVANARSHLDWLLTWLPHGTADADWSDERSGANQILKWRIYDETDAAFGDESLPPAGPPAGPHNGERSDGDSAKELQARLAWRYPFAAATVEAAKTSVSAIRRRAADEADDEARKIFDARMGRRAGGTRPSAGAAPLTAAERGTAHHLFLQLLDLERAGSEPALSAAARELLETGRMKPEQVAALDFAALAAFWQSDLGRRIRANPGCVRRELAFTARFAPGELAAVMGKGDATNSREDFVVVQGVADLAVLREGEIWLLDFKTDEVSAGQVAEKAKHYGPQLKLYALALARIYGRPVTESWLHFLALPTTVQVTPFAKRYEQGELF